MHTFHVLRWPATDPSAKRLSDIIHFEGSFDAAKSAAYDYVTELAEAACEALKATGNYRSVEVVHTERTTGVLTLPLDANAPVFALAEDFKETAPNV